MKVVVYARTSGDEESTGQDVRQQAALVADQVAQLGHVVVSTVLEDGVSGSHPAPDRAGWRRALKAARDAGAAIAIREISRFSRYAPHRALLDLDELDVHLLCLTEDAFTTLHRPHPTQPGQVMIQLVLLWQAWAELVGIRTKTQAAMTAIAEGRPTKSGRPPGRPKVEVPEAWIEEARSILSAEGLAAAHRHVQRKRGFFDALDPETRRARDIGRETVARLLGVRGGSEKTAQNPKAPKTTLDQEAGAGVGNGPLLDAPGNAEPGGAPPGGG